MTEIIDGIIFIYQILFKRSPVPNMSPCKSYDILSVLLVSINTITINVNGAHTYSRNSNTQTCLPFGSICDISINDQCCIGMACVNTYIYKPSIDYTMCTYPILAPVPSLIKPFEVMMNIHPKIPSNH